MTKRQQALDVAIAAVVAFGCTLEVWAPKDFGSTHMTGPRAAVYVSYLIAAAALAFRRRFPLASCVVMSAALSLEWLIFGAPEGFGAFITLVISGYSVAAYQERDRALLCLGLLSATGAIWIIRDPVQVSVGRMAGGVLWLTPMVIAWLLGAYAHTRRLYVAALSERADRAEREREESAEAAVASERARIARELHDIVAHSVSVMVVQAEAADEMLNRQAPERARAPVSKIQETGRAALTDMRRMLGLLRETDARPTLMPQPGIANIELLLAKVRESGLPVELEVQGRPEALPPGVDLSAYRIVQEALTNSLRYAGGAHARVVVRYGPGALELEVEDDGSGEAGDPNGGHGLIGMRERVALFGGELEAGPVPGRGFRVRARLPLEARP